VLKPGDRVNLTYYEGEGQIESSGWVVDDYDNGLLKATHEPSPFVQVVKAQAGREKDKTETVVFNLRSIGFLKAELVTESEN